MIETRFDALIEADVYHNTFAIKNKQIGGIAEKSTSAATGTQHHPADQRKTDRRDTLLPPHDRNVPSHSPRSS